MAHPRQQTLVGKTNTHTEQYSKQHTQTINLYLNSKQKDNTAINTLHILVLMYGFIQEKTRKHN
jgi:hypothetical protein